MGKAGQRKSHHHYSVNQLILTDDTRTLNKRYTTLGGDKIDTGSNVPLTGRYTTRRWRWPDDYLDMNLAPNQCLMIGNVRKGNRRSGEYGTDDADGCIRRTKDYIGPQRGSHSIIVFDIESSSTLEHLPPPFDFGNIERVHAELSATFGVESIEAIAMPSSGMLAGRGARWHVYVLVKGALDLDAAKQRLTLFMGRRGHIQTGVNTNGVLIPGKSTFSDIEVFQNNRVLFEAAPEFKDGSQPLSIPRRHFSGSVPDAAALMEPLDAIERDELDGYARTLHLMTRKLAKRRRRGVARAQARVIGKRNAVNVMTALERGHIYDGTLVHHNGTLRSIADIVAECKDTRFSRPFGAKAAPNDNSWAYYADTETIIAYSEGGKRYRLTKTPPKEIELHVERYITDGGRIKGVLPRYDEAKKQCVMIDAPTGSGKTHGAMTLAKHFRKQGTRFVIIAVPTKAIGRAKETPKWRFQADGKLSFEGEGDQWLASWDNLKLLPDEVLHNAVIFVDEIHQVPRSGFRAGALGALARVFVEAPYVIGMTGTLNWGIFKSDFSNLIRVVPKHSQQAKLHAVEARVKRSKSKVLDSGEVDEWRALEPLEMVRLFMREGFRTAGRPLVVFIEDKALLHGIKEVLLETYGLRSVIQHSGESAATVESDEVANRIIETGEWPDDIDAMLTTSGAVAGWDLGIRADFWVYAIRGGVGSVDNLRQIAARSRTDVVDVYAYFGREQLGNKRRESNYDPDYIDDHIDELKREFEVCKGRDLPDGQIMLGKPFEWVLKQEYADRHRDGYFTRLRTDYEAYTRELGFDDVQHYELELEHSEWRAAEERAVKDYELVKALNGWCDKDTLRAFVEDGDEDGFIGCDVDVIRMDVEDCKALKRPVLPRWFTVVELLRVYDTEELETYLMGKDHLSPSTLLANYNDGRKVFFNSIKARRKLVRKFSGKMFTAAELAKFMRRGGFEKPVLRVKGLLGKRTPQVRTMLRGVCRFEVTGRSKSGERLYHLSDASPFDLPVRSDVFLREMKWRGFYTDDREYKRLKVLICG